MLIGLRIAIIHVKLASSFSHHVEGNFSRLFYLVFCELSFASLLSSLTCVGCVTVGAISTTSNQPRVDRLVPCVMSASISRTANSLTICSVSFTASQMLLVSVETCSGSDTQHARNKSLFKRAHTRAHTRARTHTND